MQYGIGTYIRELTKSLIAHTDLKIFLVNYHNSECLEYSIENISNRYVKINIPTPRVRPIQSNSFDNKYASSVVKLISDVIPKDEEIVFQMNYIDDLPIVRKLKDVYSHAVISVVHFAQWQQIFQGNKQKLAGLNIDNPSNNIEFTLASEKEMYLLSDHIISVTSYMKDFLTERFNLSPDKIDIVPNGLDIGCIKSFSIEQRLELRSRFGFNSSEKIIIFSGRIDICKGIFFLIDAFIEACKQNSDIRLVVIGQGEINDCLIRSNLFYGKITYTDSYQQIS